MQITTKEQLQKALDDNTTIYGVHGLGPSSWNTEYVLSNEAMSIRNNGIGDYLIKNGVSSSQFFLQDFNCEGGGYNHHKLFDNKQEADEYCAWAKENTPPIKLDRWYDCYDDYGYDDE